MLIYISEVYRIFLRTYVCLNNISVTMLYLPQMIYFCAIANRVLTWCNG